MNPLTCQACADFNEQAKTESKVEMTPPSHQAQPWNAKQCAALVQVVLGAVVHSGQACNKSVIRVCDKLELQTSELSG